MLPRCSDVALKSTTVRTKQEPLSPPPKRKLRYIHEGPLQFKPSLRGNQVLHVSGHKYIRNNVYGQNVYWKCTKWHSGCRARVITSLTDATKCYPRSGHNHGVLSDTLDVKAE